MAAAGVGGGKSLFEIVEMRFGQRNFAGEFMWRRKKCSMLNCQLSTINVGRGNFVRYLSKNSCCNMGICCTRRNFDEIYYRATAAWSNIFHESFVGERHASPACLHGGIGLVCCLHQVIVFPLT